MRCVFVSSEIVCPRESRGMLLRRAVHSHRGFMERKRQEGSYGKYISADAHQAHHASARRRAAPVRGDINIRKNKATSLYTHVCVLGP